MSHSDTRDPLEELAAEFTERCRRGEQPSVESYAAQHPELADDIRGLFSMIRDVEHAKDALGSSDLPASDAVCAVERLGDFRIVRELGRGGMGIVYEAEQESLGRRVAIKVLPHTFVSSPNRRERFEREARTAAKLHHTNIVPIFGVGEQDGYPYFVMQYIRGVGLDVVFRKLFEQTTRRTAGQSSLSSLGVGRSVSESSRPTGSARFDFAQLALSLLGQSVSGRHDDRCWSAGPTDEQRPGMATRTAVAMPPDAHGLTEQPLTSHYWRSLAELIAEAADALAYAHSQGVLHRDIKPSNLLLDADGALWVTDFGLAKTGEHADITQPGDVIGTLKYMAPEQFSHAGDARSDVYGLGVTLYELAILQPAFVETDGSSTMRSVLEQSLWPARRLCPTLPRDIETIIEKATDRDPAHRYPSAAALRDDLRRFIEDRPIEARRISIPERMWRWSRRNPALAGSTAAAVVLLLAVAIVSSAAFFHVRKANQHVASALVSEKQQRQLAESTADLAAGALDKLFEEFAPEGTGSGSEVKLDATEGTAVSVAAPPVLSAETANALKAMLPYYAEFAQRAGASRELRLRMAKAQQRVGEIQERLGNYDDARKAYGESVRQYQQLLASEDDKGRVRVLICQLHEQLGLVSFAEGRLADATLEFNSAQKLLEPLASGMKPTPEVRFELARIQYLMGRSPMSELPRPEPGRPPPGQRPPPPPLGDRGPGLGRPRPGGPGPRALRPFPPPGDGPRRPGFPPDENDADGPGPPPREMGPGPFGPPEQRGADDRPPPLEERSEPGAMPRPEFLPAGQREQMIAQFRSHLDDAIRRLRELSAESPQTADYRHLLAQALRERSSLPLLELPKDRPVLNADLEESIKLLEHLVEEFPNSPQYTFDLCQAYAARPGDPRHRKDTESAVQMMEDLTGNRPGIPSYSFTLSTLYFRLSQLDRIEHRQRDAETDLKDALDLQKKLTAKFPTVESYVLTAAFYELDFARMFGPQERWAEAQQHAQSAVNRIESLDDSQKNKPHVKLLLRECRLRLADVLSKDGKDDEARAVLEKIPRGERPPIPLSRPAVR